MHEAVHRRMPSVSLSTVYRNLERLVEDGLVAKIEVPGGPAHFDAAKDPHYHIFCTVCGRVADVPFESAPGIDEMAARSSGFTDVHHTIEFFGICPKCRQSMGTERSGEAGAGRRDEA